MRFLIIYGLFFSLVTTGCVEFFMPYSTRASIKSNERLKTHINKIKGELSSREHIFYELFDEEKTDYEDIQCLTSIGNDLAFSAKKDDEYFLIYKGKVERKYNTHIQPIDVNGKLLYYLTNGHDLIVMYDGKEIIYDTRVYKIGDLHYPIAIGGTLAFYAEKQDRDIILWDGKEIGNEYEWVGRPKEINGKLTFSASIKDHREIFTVYDGKIISDKNSLAKGIKNLDKEVLDHEIDYSSVTAFNGVSAYIAKDSEGAFVRYGEESGERYESIKKPLRFINGKITYIGILNGWKHIVWGDKRIAKYPKHYYVNLFDHIKNHVVYVAIKHFNGRYDIGLFGHNPKPDRYILGMDGKEKVFGKYIRPFYPYVINDKLLYWEFIGVINQICVYDGQELKLYDNSSEPTYINGKQIIAGYRDKTWFLIKQK